MMYGFIRSKKKASTILVMLLIAAFLPVGSAPAFASSLLSANAESAAKVEIGMPSQLAGNINISELNAGALHEDTELCMTLTTNGVKFDSVPGLLIQSGFVDFDDCQITPDFRTLKWRVLAASTEPSRISLTNIKYSVASNASPGEVSVRLSTTDGVVFNTDKIVNARIALPMKFDLTEQTNTGYPGSLPISDTVYDVSKEAKSGSISVVVNSSYELSKSSFIRNSIKIRTSEDAVMGGCIKGRVSGDAVEGIKSLKGLMVTAIPIRPDGSIDSYKSGLSVTTNESGAYSISGLSSGLYKVYFDSKHSISSDATPFINEFVPEYYDSKSLWQAANIIEITEDSVETDVNAILDYGAVVTGTVTGTDGTPLSSVRVNLIPVDGLGNQLSSVPQPSAVTDANGNYRVDGIGKGSYRVHFSPANNSDYLGEYYNNQPSFENATVLTLSPKSVKNNINAKLKLGGTISGNVTNSAKKPIKNIHVLAYPVDSDGNKDLKRKSSGWALTDVNGNYSINGLDGGLYKIEFRSYSFLNFQREFYQNKVTFEEADVVNVLLGAETNSIDAVLDEGCIVRGYVKAKTPNEEPIRFVLVQAFPVDTSGNDDLASGRYVGYAHTNSNGLYEIAGLKPGKYKIQYYPQGDTNFVPQYFNDKKDWDTATIVDISLGLATSLPDIQLHPAATISGTVTGETDAGQKPLKGILVTTYPVDSNGEISYGQPIKSEWTDSNGAYSIIGLSPGDYKVFFDTVAASNYNPGHSATGDATPDIESYIPQYYEDKMSWNSANRITLTEGAKTSGIDAELKVGGKISGTVTGRIGDVVAALCGVMVNAIPVDANGDFDDGREEAVAYTNGDGSYSILGLSSGDYAVLFDPQTGSSYDATIDVPLFVGGFYQEEQESDFSKVNVVRPKEIGNINAVLELGGSINGKAVDQAGNPITGLVIEVYSSDVGFDRDTYPVAVAVTNKLGNYAITGLPAGDYKIAAGLNQLERSHQWFNSKPLFANANVINLTAGQRVKNIDFSFAQANNEPVTIGSNVVVVPGYGIKLKFDNIEQEGSILINTIDKASMQIPSGFMLLGDIYDVETTADHLGDILLTFPYNSNMSEDDENNLRLYHWNGSEWEDVTVSIDKVANTITGKTSSLSPFTVVKKVQGGSGSGGGGGATQDGPPAKPEAVKIASANNVIHLVWNPNKEDDLKGYRVYRADGSNGSGKLSGSLLAEVNDVQYKDQTAKQGQKYTYFVSAVDRIGNESVVATIEASLATVKGSMAFSDVSSNAWYNSYLPGLIEKGILGGYSDGTFKPDKAITRAEFAKTICVAMGWSLISPAEQSFSDVSKSDWAYSFIETAKAHGVVGGYADGAFKPDANIARAEIAKIIAQTLGLQTGTSTLNDVSSSWAKGYIGACISAGIISGYTDNSFKPNRSATRAEAAKILSGIVK